MRSRGLTLLEALVALAITALVLAALGNAVRRAAAARAETTRVADRTAASRTFLLALATELEAAGGPGSAMPRAFVVEPPRRDRPWSTLGLVTATRGSARTGPAGDVQGISYRVVPDPLRPGVGILVRSEAIPFAAPEAVLPVGLPILEGVRHFRVRGYDGSDWRDAWMGPPAPRAVEVALGIEEPSGSTEELVTRVTLAAAPR